MNAAESKRAMAMLQERERNARGGTTDEMESVFRAPQSIFRFTKGGTESIRYLLFHEDAHFVIEVAVGGSKIRKSFFGDDTLRTNVKEMIRVLQSKEK